MNQIAQRPCPICGCGRVEGLHHQRFELPDGHPLSGGYEVVACSACGFVYADTAVPQAAYDRFYTQYSKYEDARTGTGGVENSWDRERQALTARQIADYLDNPIASILDIGCANGGLLWELNKLGYHDLLGVDPSSTCVQNTRNLGIQAEIGSIFQPLKHGNFDCVILSHTLEHIQDLHQAVCWIHKVLKDTDSSCTYIEVPDAMRYVDYVDSPFQDFNTEHINHFSNQCLHNYLRINRFEPMLWGEKIIPASMNKQCPAIFCFACKNREKKEIIPDPLLKQKILAYIDISTDILDQFGQRISQALEESRRIIVWGTGQLTMKLLVETSLATAEIVAFIDNNPINHGKKYHGISIFGPEYILGLPDPILIASTLHQKSIQEQIEKMGLPNKLVLLKDA